MPPSSALTHPNYAAIRDILDDKIRPNTIVNVVGIVVDFRAPIPTKGKGIALPPSASISSNPTRLEMPNSGL
jgi:hypothetical protein